MRQLSGVYLQAGPAVLMGLCINKRAMACEISSQHHVILISLVLTLIIT